MAAGTGFRSFAWVVASLVPAVAASTQAAGKMSATEVGLLLEKSEDHPDRLAELTAMAELGRLSPAVVFECLEARAKAGEPIAGALALVEVLGPDAGSRAGELYDLVQRTALRPGEFVGAARACASIIPFGRGAGMTMIEYLRSQLKHQKAELRRLSRAGQFLLGDALGRGFERGRVDLRDTSLQNLLRLLAARRIHRRAVAAQAIARRNKVPVRERLRILEGRLREVAGEAPLSWIEHGGESDRFELVLATELVRLRRRNPAAGPTSELGLAVLVRRHPSARVRRRAATLLGDGVTRPGLDALAAAAGDGDPGVAVAAMRALGQRARQHGKEAALPKKWVLIEGLYSHEDRVRDAAMEAIRALDAAGAAAEKRPDRGRSRREPGPA